MHLFFAGLWPLVAHFGLGVVLIAGLVAAAVFSPVFKNGFIWLASIVAVTLVAYTVGVHDADKRVRAQAAVYSQQVAEAVAKAKSDQALEDKYDNSRLDVPAAAPAPVVKCPASRHVKPHHWFKSRRVRKTGTTDPWDSANE